MSTKEKVNTTKTDSPSKSKSSKAAKSEKLASKNIDKTSKKAKEVEEDEAEPRALKYQYPSDVNTAIKKKEFRRKARATYDRLKKTMRKFKKATDEEGQKSFAAAEKEYNKFMKEVMSEGAVPRQ